MHYIYKFSFTHFYQMEEAHNIWQGYGCCHPQSPLPSIPHNIHTTDLATHIHHFIHDTFAFHIQATKPAEEQKMLKLIQ